MTASRERASTLPSLFRAGVPARLIGALALSGLLWLAIVWATA